MIGTTVSHYRILEKLGEGGMGVVYKAQDTNLDRSVALKFLPAHVSINEDTKARFMQEAKAAAALNHAHICTIHGVEESQGQMFIVMEHIDGGTLRGRIPFARVEDATAVALQIAEALQEAHVKGIVHRDIKADNVMLTAKGQAKVMDFGLAKLKGSLKLTKTSSTVGTLGYMAPEQIQGGEVDLRSDVFSFGVLLFEMLTGKLPFRGEHEAAMVYSIVNEEPQPLESLRPEVSPLLSNLIAKCLEKDPADRYQHMDDIVSELRRAQKKTSRVMRAPAFPAGPATPPNAASGQDPQSEIPAVGRRQPWVRYGIAGAAIFVLAAAGLLIFTPGGISVNPDMTTRVLQVPFTQYSYPSLSPDGKWIAFPAGNANGEWDIYYMHVGGGEPRKITSDATVFIQQSADISPDGSQVVYDKPSADGSTYDIFAISALGGTSRKLVPRGSSPQWRPDGARVGFIRQPTNSRIRSESPFVEFWSVGADGSDLKREFQDSLFVARGNYRYNFCWSYDGKSIAWIRSFSPESQVLVTRNIETGSEKQLTDGKENIDAMEWTKDDRIIFSSNRGGNTNLWAIPASGGEVVQVTKGAGPDIAVSFAGSGNDLVYLQQQPVGFLWTANIDGSSMRQISFDEREIWEPSFSPDNNRIAFVMSDPDPLREQCDVYVVDRDGNNRRKLTNGLPNARIPRWSPDGRLVSYVIFPHGPGIDTLKPRTFVVDTENPGAPRLAGDFPGVLWADNDHILALDPRSSYLLTVSKSTSRRFMDDSLAVWYFGQKSIGYYDWRLATMGWWIVDVQSTSVADLLKQTGDVIMPAFRGMPRKFSSAPPFLGRWTSRSTQSGTFLQFESPDKVRSISFTGGKEIVLPARFVGLRNRSIEPSYDGKEVVFVTPRLSSRLVMLENVFQ
ncbi:MAG: protein kinase [Bacteroidota bacterium]